MTPFTPNTPSHEQPAEGEPQSGSPTFAQTFARHPGRTRLGLLPEKRVWLAIGVAAGLVAAVSAAPPLVELVTADSGDGTRQTPVAMDNPLRWPAASGEPEKSAAPEPSTTSSPAVKKQKKTVDTPPPGLNAAAAQPPTAQRATPKAAKSGQTSGAGGKQLKPSVTGPTGTITGLADKCMDVANFGTANGTPIQIQDCNGTTAQVWTMASDSTIRAYGKCLTVSQNATSDGSRVVLWDCRSDFGGQKWVYSSGRDVVNVPADKCLDVSGADASNGTKLQIAWCSGNAAQKWYVPS